MIGHLEGGFLLTLMKKHLGFLRSAFTRKCSEIISINDDDWKQLQVFQMSQPDITEKYNKFHQKIPKKSLRNKKIHKKYKKTPRIAGVSNVPAWHHLCHPQQSAQAHPSSGEVSLICLQFSYWWWPYHQISSKTNHCYLRQGNVHRPKLWRDLAAAGQGEVRQGSHQDGIRLHSRGHAGGCGCVLCMWL